MAITFDSGVLTCINRNFVIGTCYGVSVIFIPLNADFSNAFLCFDVSNPKFDFSGRDLLSAL